MRKWFQHNPDYIHNGSRMKKHKSWIWVFKEVWKSLLDGSGWNPRVPHNLGMSANRRYHLTGECASEKNSRTCWILGCTRKLMPPWNSGDRKWTIAFDHWAKGF